jgi:hypothetical protein
MMKEQQRALQVEVGRRLAREEPGAVAEPIGERGVRGAGALVLQAAFVETKIRDCAFESRGRHECEISGSVTEILADAGGERGEKDLIPHRETEVLKLVSDGLEAHAVGVQGEVALRSAEELLLQEDDALELVVGEEPVYLRPKRAGIITVADTSSMDESCCWSERASWARGQRWGHRG